MTGPQNRLCLFTFRPIASKQLNGLTTIDILSWLGGAIVTHPLGCKRSRVQSPTQARVFMFDFLYCFCCVFSFCPKTHCHKKCNSFFNANLFSSLYTLQDLWLIVRYKDTDLASLIARVIIVCVRTRKWYFSTLGTPIFCVQNYQKLLYFLQK